MKDPIERQAAIDAMTNTLWHYPNECYRNLNEYEFAKGLAELGLKSVPSAQPEIIDAIWDALSRVYNMPDVPDEAKSIIGDVMLGLSSAQPERKTGKWIPDNNNYITPHFICSACGLSQKVETVMYRPIWAWCPRCGARMMEVKDETD